MIYNLNDVSVWIIILGAHWSVFPVLFTFV